MVTVDYSLQEFEELVQRFCELYNPYSVSVVDSFGCMEQSEVFSFIEILDRCISKDIKIGFHGHDNMQLAQTNAISLLNNEYDREFIVDASAGGIGRGAGNLCTELFVNYMNLVHKKEYNLDCILSVISEVTEPISRVLKWGYSPYFMLTALRRAHPNFATYLIANHDVSVNDFKKYLDLIPDNMLTKCTRPYVEELYEHYISCSK